MPERPARLPLLDELRGFSMTLVMLYHLGYDLSVMVGLPMPWFWDTPVQTARDLLAAGALMVISGVSCSLSRSNLRRGVRTLALALLLTAVTGFFMPGEYIVFGVLHFFGCCMLLWHFIGPRLARFASPMGVALCLLLFVLLRFVPQGYAGLPFARLILPRALYQSRWLFWLGFPGPGFQSADYYPLIPWGFLFFAGGLAGLMFRSRGFPAAMQRSYCPPLGVIGRHTMLLYLAHQPVLLALLALIFDAL